MTTTLSNPSSAKFHYEFSLGGMSFNQQNNNITSSTGAGHIYYNLLPVVKFKYNFNQNEFLHVNYLGYSEMPFLYQLQPLPDLSNPYLIKLGNPDLKESFTNLLIFNYSAIFHTNQFLNLSLEGTETGNMIGLATNTLPGGVQQVQYVNLNGIYNMDLNAQYSFPLIKQENGTSSIGSKILYGHNLSVINGIDNAVKDKGVNGNLSLHFHRGKTLFIDAGGSIEYLANQYSLVNEPGSASWQRDYNINITYILPFSMSIGAIYDLQAKAISGLPGQRTNLFNAFISRDVFGRGAGQLRLSGFNLLNASSAISQSTGPNYTEIDKTNALHRFVLLSLVYNFSKFKKKQ